MDVACCKRSNLLDLVAFRTHQPEDQTQKYIQSAIHNWTHNKTTVLSPIQSHVCCVVDVVFHIFWNFCWPGSHLQYLSRGSPLLGAVRVYFGCPINTIELKITLLDWWIGLEIAGRCFRQRLFLSENQNGEKGDVMRLYDLMQGGTTDIENEFPATHEACAL